MVSARLVLAVLALAACRPQDIVSPLAEICEGYAPWTSSVYVLPYPVGTSYKVIQGNCAGTSAGHRNANKYAYDWDMAIGTPFTAVRTGKVIEVQELHEDGQLATTGKDNYIGIRHADGSIGMYGHLTNQGSLVAVGDSVHVGDRIGFSGNTGNTANVPHLHFSLHVCDPVTGGSNRCYTVPVTFRNTDPNERGPQPGQFYPAKPY